MPRKKKPLPQVMPCNYCKPGRIVLVKFCSTDLRRGWWEHVKCGKCKSEGPKRRTMRGGILAWNRLMGG